LRFAQLTNAAKVLPSIVGLALSGITHPAHDAKAADGKRRRRPSVSNVPSAIISARKFLRNADPVLARLIDARPGFRPRAWMDELPPLGGFATLVFQVAGQ
jgi:hypothetical protein